MPLAIIYTGVTIVTSAVVGVGSYLIGCWRGRDQCWREVLSQQQRHQDAPTMGRSDTGILADFGRDRLKREMFDAMIHDKGVRRDGGSGDLRQ